MQGNQVFLNGPLGSSIDWSKDRVLVSCHGKETYQLTDKRSGQTLLAGFESPVAAKRFFSENPEYFFSKII